ncbi:uncharacterized protein GGS22DRAFT_165929 [Annulohypoxylon maeteangense]|uniref:uncharacterized protein n=1 Tax=Annulohypoxylon maeteangense TaxID=1927788 RepID=UPI0020087C7C|nr:uncharacterized protein GGS22DRAFT_165929 [Annulohypoxylon maeteangense]KAI0883723.1 hypothetical protein GGS22DRAFT_165929 [Annulohypoxylon maeteangense]
MAIPQLPNVDGLLVTADNPARADLLGIGMDHARCAALHNYLIHNAWISEGRPPAALHGNNINTYFTTHGGAAEALRPRLHPSLAAFLDDARLPPDGLERAPFFFWANEFTSPGEFFAEPEADLFDEPADSLVCLYSTNIGQGGSSGGGLFYHQGIHRAAVFMHMDDHDFALPVQAHLELWHPLETVLSNWIELIRLGKITASPREAAPLFVGEKIGPWEWHPYSEAQVNSCVHAWDRLCNAIESRMPPSPSTPANPPEPEPEPLLAPPALDAASIPSPSFARAFLSRARRPHFRSIAPGLLLPPASAASFTASQPFTHLPHPPQVVPPVCIFPAANSDLQADVTGWLNPFHEAFREPPAPSRVPAGVYTESVDRSVLDTAEEGFRLLLPYGLHGDSARKSDGSGVSAGSATELFQHGYKPFGGDYYRPQRLERLLDHWCGLVVRGVWDVGPRGVEGEVERFREADGAARWRDYVISPTW